MKKTLSKKAMKKREAYIEWLTNIQGWKYENAVRHADLFDWEA